MFTRVLGTISNFYFRKSFSSAQHRSIRFRVKIFQISLQSRDPRRESCVRRRRADESGCGRGGDWVVDIVQAQQQLLQLWWWNSLCWYSRQMACMSVPLPAVSMVVVCGDSIACYLLL